MGSLPEYDGGYYAHGRLFNMLGALLVVCLATCGRPSSQLTLPPDPGDGAGHIVARKLGLVAMIDAHVSIDEQKASTLFGVDSIVNARPSPS
jgi:hypothetical protein